MPFNQLTDAEAERLALLLEELGEAQQAIGKILRHGYASMRPMNVEADNDIYNRDDLEKELGDVAAAISLMCDAGDINPLRIKQYQLQKLENVEKYLHHQEASHEQ